MNTLFWFRRDLRLKDNTGLTRALAKGTVKCVFVFDTTILNKLKSNTDRRVQFLIESLKELNEHLNTFNTSLEILHGDPIKLIPKYLKHNSFQKLVFNRDYDSYSLMRDKNICEILNKESISFESYKDSVIFENTEVLKHDGTPYHVYTAYKNKWLDCFFSNKRNIELSKPEFGNLIEQKKITNISIKDWMKKLGFNCISNELVGGEKAGLLLLEKFKTKIDDYKINRDFVAIEGTSNLSVHLRFGSISIRDCVRACLNFKSEGAKTWLQELIWRDFYSMILSTYPHTEHNCFKSNYDNIKWVDNDDLFLAWSTGKTGFPIIDASMRCLNETGRLHNRLRMINASFFCKTLRLHWKKGERYFAEKLLDYDKASNVGGWQWGASTGCDAAPYFRIFNPWLQSKKFDKDAFFIKRWLPELRDVFPKSFHDPVLLKQTLVSNFGISHNKYMSPIVDYKKQRELALEMYKKGVKC